MRYVATETKPDQVIYMDAGKCVNSFVYRVLINRTTESRTEDRRSRFAEAFSSTATLGCAVLSVDGGYLPNYDCKTHTAKSGCATKTCSESSFSARANDFG